MKYCEFCGQEIPTGKRCSCEEAVQKANKMKKRTVTVVLISALVLIAIILVSLVASSQKIDPSEYLGAPVFSGPDTMGAAKVTFDKDGLIKHILGETPADFLSDEYMEWLEKYEEYSAGIRCEYPNGDLCNGDAFVVTITAIGKAAEKVKNFEVAYTVSGLVEIEPVDIFAYIEVSFSGISGDATAKVVKNTDDEIVKACHLQVDNPRSLCNGDVITVTITNADSLLSVYNVVPTETSKTYTVSGLGAYATAEDLPLDKIQTIADQFAAERNAKNEEETGTMFSYSDVQLYGVYFAVGKEDGAPSNNNELHILISYDEYLYGECRETIYLPLIFENLVVGQDGNIELEYEDGHGKAFFYTDAEKYLSDLAADYTVEKVK